jgi:hypothetical protein
MSGIRWRTSDASTKASPRSASAIRVGDPRWCELVRDALAVIVRLLDVPRELTIGGELRPVIIERQCCVAAADSTRLRPQ